MEFLRQSPNQTLPYPSTRWQCNHNQSGRFSFNAELCGIWLGELPFNQHLDATALPAHMAPFMHLTPRNQRHAFGNEGPSHVDPFENMLPQRASRKTSSTFSISHKNSAAEKCNAPNFHNNATLQLEACKISGSLAFSNGSLVFISREADVKVPSHLGGPGDLELLNIFAPKSPRHSSKPVKYNICLPRLHVDRCSYLHS